MSLNDTLKYYGFKCKKNVSAINCKSHCNCEKWVVVYAYIKKDANAEAIRLKFQGSDFFNDPWGQFRGQGIDYHAIVGIPGDSNSYRYQSHDQPKSQSPMFKPTFKPSESKPDYFADDQLLLSTCCCKPNAE
jgi:hypothetical protein